MSTPAARLDTKGASKGATAGSCASYVVRLCARPCTTHVCGDDGEVIDELQSKRARRHLGRHGR